ncbi:hypothetical protein GLGR_2797, partial [Leminorella grimontii ATCC 33999 = DSM 5078]
MAAVGQRSGRRKAPVAGRVRRDGAQQGGAVVDAHRAARLSGAVQGRRAVVGNIALLQGAGNGAFVVHYRHDHRRRRPGAVQCDAVLGARIGGIARRVDLDRRQVVVAAQQRRGRTQRPSAVFRHRSAANLMVAGAVLGVHHDGVAGGAGAADGRTAVVGRAAAGDIALDFTNLVVHAGDGQIILIWRRNIDRKAKTFGRSTCITGFVRSRHSELVLTLAQRSIRRKAPMTVFIRRRRTNDVAVVVEGDCTIWLALAVKGRLSIVGDAAVSNLTGNSTHIVNHAPQYRFIRRSG